MNSIKNTVGVVSKFDRSIKLELRRFGAKRFGHVCKQTGKRLFLEYGTCLDAAVGVAGRYHTHQSYDDCAYVNPKCVAKTAGLEFALDFLISAGFVRIEKQGKERCAVIVAGFDMAQNQ